MKTAHVQRYLEDCDGGCLYCGDPDVVGGPVTIEDGVARQKMDCNGCDAEWLDYYSLDRVGLIDSEGDIQVFGREGPE